MQSIDNIKQLLFHKNIDAVMLSSAENTAYLTGINGFEGIVFIEKSGKSYCFTDSRYIEIACNITTSLGYCTTTVPQNDYYKEIARICKEECISKIGFEDKFISVSSFEKIKKAISCDFVGISDEFLKMRAVKSQWETDNIIAAQRIAEKALDILLGEIKPGMTENECKARLEYLMTLFGSEKTSFSTILISGAKTSMPHGATDHKEIEFGDFITFDFGAVVNGYCSDMTRTVAVGSVSDEMKKVYDTVLNAQLAGIDAAQAGRTGAEIDRVARDIISSAGYGQYFGHALGHGVGIEIHEEPKVSPSNGEVLPEGSVITIEPGIYIPGHFGVRIEDMLYIKTNGNTNLTNYPKNLIIL